MTDPTFSPNKPLSTDALSCLGRAAKAAFAAQDINPGVCGQLVALGFAELKKRPSPDATHQPGTAVSFLVITPKGRQALNETQETHT